MGSRKRLSVKRFPEIGDVALDQTAAKFCVGRANDLTEKGASKQQKIKRKKKEVKSWNLQ